MVTIIIPHKPSSGKRFSLLQKSRLAMAPTQLPIWWIPGASFLGDILNGGVKLNAPTQYAFTPCTGTIPLHSNWWHINHVWTLSIQYKVYDEINSFDANWNHPLSAHRLLILTGRPLHHATLARYTHMLEDCKISNFKNLWIWLQIFKFIDYKYYYSTHIPRQRC
jgi:hypothetical protein